jgi:hypothetical protein
MAVRVTATGASEIQPGTWTFDIPPHQIRHFGQTNHALGATSVLVLMDCEYDAERQQLHFAIDDAIPINVGTTSRVIGIAAGLLGSGTPEVAPPSSPEPGRLGPGDREFLRLAKAELSERMAQTAENLLLAVRKRSAGDLKRGKARNFSETPDNFWYVIIQNRIDELSITVRGPVNHFAGVSSLDVKDDRGNTRFKVRTEADVTEALRLILHAHRKV